MDQRGPLSTNIKINDGEDTVEVYGQKITGDLLRTMTEATPPGIWFRMVKPKDEDGNTVLSVERREFPNAL